MDAELKAYLDERFASIDRRFAEMDQRFATVDRRFEEVEERIERTETKLLTAFYSWAKATDIRTRSAQERVTALEDRITDV